MWWNSYQIKLNIGSLRKFFVGSNISLMDLWIVALGLHRWQTKRIQYIHGKKNQDFKLSSRCHSQISSQIQEVSVLVAVWLIELVDCPSWESEANLWWGLVSYFVDFYHRPKVCVFVCECVCAHARIVCVWVRTPEKEWKEVVNCQIFFPLGNASLGRNMAPSPPLSKMKAMRDRREEGRRETWKEG